MKIETKLKLTYYPTWMILIMLFPFTLGWFILSKLGMLEENPIEYYGLEKR